MNTAKLVTLTLFAVGMSMSACDFLIDDGYDLTIQTDRIRYEAGQQVTYTIENVGERTVYSPCGGCDHVQEWIGDEHNKTVWGWGCAQCSRPDPIAPGEQIVRNVHFRDAEFSSQVQYRVFATICRDEDLSELLDEEDLLSNRFEIVP